MSSFLCFVCHSTVNADTNEETREKYREVIGMNLCPDSHLCYICCYFLNKMWMFKSICLKRSLEYPVLFSEKGTINLHRSEISVSILCPENICIQHLNTRYHFYNNNENSQSDFDDNNYCELQDDRNFDINDTLLKTATIENFRNEDYLFVTKDNIDYNLFNEELLLPNLEPVRITQNDLVDGEWTQNIPKMNNNKNTLLELNCKNYSVLENLVIPAENSGAISIDNHNNMPLVMRIDAKEVPIECSDTQNLQEVITGLNYVNSHYEQVENCVNENIENSLFENDQSNIINQENNLNNNISIINDDVSNINRNTIHINHNEPNINHNTINMNGNVSNIGHNATNINGNVSNISHNATNINDNVSNIGQNTMILHDNTTNINHNTVNISGNKSNIGHNATSIDDNLSNMGHNAINVNDNTTNINHNTVNINGNKSNIGKNTTNIDDNLSNMSHNTMNVNDNTTNINNIATNVNGDVSCLNDNVINVHKETYQNDNETNLNVNETNQYDNITNLNDRETNVNNSETNLNAHETNPNDNENILNEHELNINETDINGFTPNNNYSDGENTFDADNLIDIEGNYESTEQKPKKHKRKTLFKKITLTLEEQKLELERARRDEKYVTASYKCHSCAIYFHFKDTYQTHMMRHEESNGEHFCSVCSLRFANPAVLRSHRANNHSDRYRCRLCGDAVRAKQRPTHARHCAGEQDSVDCTICGRRFQSVQHYQQHRRRFHGSSARRYLCNVCGKSYDTRPHLRTHIITHINRKFECDQCTATFSSPYTLNQHKKSKHVTKEPEYHHCAACNLTYHTRKSLVAHLRNALAHKESVYKCGVCAHPCPSQSALERHTAAVHTRPRHLHCRLCHKRYSTDKALVRHMRSHKEDRPCPLCHACGALFKSTTVLNRHLKNVCEKDTRKCPTIEEELLRATFFEGNNQYH